MLLQLFLCRCLKRLEFQCSANNECVSKNFLIHLALGVHGFVCIKFSTFVNLNVFKSISICVSHTQNTNCRISNGSE